ncbi:type I DNA topoisomerase [bacterium]|nr:type I DNA topoisomerase [bacterium]
MKLVIVESPAKSKTISKYLGPGYKVVASVGHIRDLPKSNKNAIDIDAGFVPHYEISKGKEKVVDDIIAQAARAEEVLLATDPDREGEAISWHVAEAAGLKNPKRVAFNEITKEAVREAMAHPRNIDQNLRRAQEARRVLDRLVGYDLSGLIWKKLRYGLSAGRVQSPALRILCEREREIRAFIPEDYWVLSADVETAKKEKFTITCVEEPRDGKVAENIFEKAKKGRWYVVDVKESEAKRTARAPFTTSTLQQAASTRLGFSPSRTMQVAQKLYEAGHITYMRTDSTNLSGQAIQEMVGVITKEYGKEFSLPRNYQTKSKNAQEAHEAIRPSHASVKKAGATREAEQLYALIRARALASQMADAKIFKTKIVANIKHPLSTSPSKEVEGQVPDFTATGSRLLFPGWLLADPAARDEDVELPKVAPNDPLALIEVHSLGKQTEPPNRYSEAGLVKELEKRGIGRPSTYASIIKTLLDREYTTKEGKALKPTDTGEVVSQFLEKNFGDIISDTFTAEMENELDEIANGERDYEKTLRDFYTPFARDVKAKTKSLEKIGNLGPAPEGMKCPKCGGDMIVKLGKNGKFLSCARFPDCTGARMEDGKEMEGPKETGEMCPKCGSPLVERDGKFGRFIACSNYPKCKFIQKDESAKLNSTGVPCPMCVKEGRNGGEMSERRGRYGVFYSCNNYPDCKYAIKAKPTGNLCPTCGSLMMEGTKTIPERCSDKTCPNHNPHKSEKKPLEK